MKVINKELYLGAALAQIIESPRFISLEKASAMVGHYAVNGARRVLIRHTKSARGPWYFTFRPRDMALIRAELASERPFFLGLVCGNAQTCLLTAGQVAHVLDPCAEEAQSVRVSTRPGASLTVSGSAAVLKGKVPSYAFPGSIFR